MNKSIRLTYKHNIESYTALFKKNGKYFEKVIITKRELYNMCKDGSKILTN